MKKIRKSLGLFIVAFALCMLFAVGAKVEAAETKLKEEICLDEGSLISVPMVSNISKANFGCTSSSYFVSNLNTVNVVGYAPSDAYYVEAGVFDSSNQMVTSKKAYCYGGKFSCYISGISKNKVYYVRVRAIQKINYSQEILGAWSEQRAFVFLKLKAKEHENYSTGYEYADITTKKIKGIKKYKVQVSNKRDKKYKTVKTVKAGKKVTVSKYKGKKLKLRKTWYIRVIPILNSKISSDIYALYTI